MPNPDPFLLVEEGQRHKRFPGVYREPNHQLILLITIIRIHQIRGRVNGLPTTLDYPRASQSVDLTGW
jgi:hypothetical protein